MNDLIPRAERLALLLNDRHETVAVAESSAGGLVSAPPGPWPRQGRRGPQATDTGIRRGTPAWPSPGPSSALSRWKRVNGTASATCAPSPPRLWTC